MPRLRALAWLLLLPASALTLTGCGSGNGSSMAKAEMPAAEKVESISVRADPVVRSPMAALYSTSATLRAEKRATVTSRTRGVVEKLHVEEGDTVEEGTVLVELEDDEQAIALARFETILDIKSREFDRSKELHEQNLISDNEFELVRREAEESKHDVELARLNLDRTKIVAPFTGVVVQRHLDLGATVNDGTPIYDLADIEPLYADVNVPERHVNRLAVGQSVRLRTNASAEAIGARIERIAPVVDAATGTVKVTLAVAGEPRVRPGTFIEVDVVTDTRPDALVVPRAALVAEGRRWHVFRVQPGGEKVQMLHVEPGFEEGDRVEIASVYTEGASLEPGDLVVTAGASALSHEAAIRILERGTDDAADDGANP